MRGVILYIDEILFDFTEEELVFNFYWICYRGGVA